jgi:hypothetical protein
MIEFTRAINQGFASIAQFFDFPMTLSGYFICSIYANGTSALSTFRALGDCPNGHAGRSCARRL